MGAIFFQEHLTYFKKRIRPALVHVKLTQERIFHFQLLMLARRIIYLVPTNILNTCETNFNTQFNLLICGSEPVTFVSVNVYRDKNGQDGNVTRV